MMSNTAESNAQAREKDEKTLAFVTAQLRHAFSMLCKGQVTNQDQFARGFISPLIRRLEALAASPGIAEKEPITVVVNGQPVEVQPGSVRSVIEQAIAKSGQVGAPTAQWQLRTRDGDEIPHSLSDGGEWMLSGGKLLFLNLGVPPLCGVTPALGITTPSEQAQAIDFTQASEDIACERENMGLDRYCVFIEDKLREMFRRGAAQGSATPAVIAEMEREMRAVQLVAGQASVEHVDPLMAQADARLADVAGKWADRLASLRTQEGR